MRFLIVCGGKIDKEFGLNEIKTDGIDAIIAADSGMDFLYENSVTPDIIVGDFDSATTKALEFFERKGQTEIHRPQLTQPVSFKGWRRAGSTMVSKPRSTRPRAETPTMSSQTRTQRPQVIHLLLSRMTKG